MAANNTKMCSLAARISILEKQQKENTIRGRANLQYKHFNKPVIRTMEDYDKFVVTPELVSKFTLGTARKSKHEN